jgi:hypothetical protein
MGWPPPTKLVLQGAPKSRETVIHVDHYTDSARRKQIENISHAIELLPSAMAVTDCIYANDKVKRILQL